MTTIKRELFYNKDKRQFICRAGDKGSYSSNLYSAYEYWSEGWWDLNGESTASYMRIVPSELMVWE